MREIRFRIWNKIDNKFCDIRDVVVCIDGQVERAYENMYHKDYGNSKNYIIQQFTGIKDVKGNDIYEGDIVKYVTSKDWGNKEKLGQVHWGKYGDGCFEEYVQGIECWMVGKGHLPLSTITTFGVQYGRGMETNGEPCEIVGNIFENLDFLK